MGAFQDHLIGGGNLNSNRGRGGGPGLGGGNRRPNPRNRPNRNGNGGGGGGGLATPLGVSLPVTNEPLGLNAPNTGTMGGGFAIGAGTPYQAGPGASSTTQGAIYSDKDDKEAAFARENPNEAYNALMGSMGLTAGGADTMGQFLANEFSRAGGLYDQFKAMKADSANENLSLLDFLTSIVGGEDYGTPEFTERWRKHWLGQYAMAPDAQKGINGANTTGQSRWSAYF